MISQRTQPFPLRPLGPLPPQASFTPTGSQEARKGDVELNTASKKTLETWFPARSALVTQRGGSGRQTSSRMLSLELRISSELPASPAQPSALPQLGLITPGPGWRTVGRLRATSAALCASTAEEIAQILQQAREERWAALPRHAGSGRAPTARRLHISYHPVPPPPTPFVPTPVAPAQASPMPKTPTAAALIQSLLRASPRSASYGSPMEGVPERFGPVLQPKTPAFVYTPMEGVPERMGLPDMSTGKRWLHMDDDADGDSPVEGVKAQKHRQEPGAGAQPGASTSSSFAFSRAGLALTPGVHSSAAEAEAARNAHVHPLGFFAAEGARQLCQVEDVRMLDGAPRTPWRLRDYDPSPELLQRPKRPRYSLPSSLQPPAQEPGLAAQQQAAEPTEVATPQDDRPEPAATSAQAEQAIGKYDGGDDGDDDDFGGDDGGWDGDDNANSDDDTMAHDENAGVSRAHNEGPKASKVPGGAENQQPNSSSGAAQSKAQPEGLAKQLRSRRRPTSSNKRLRRDFQSRKSLAGEGLQVQGSLRRSTRRSVKPLDWWRNEKAVYERRFKSLPTVNDYTTMPSTPNWTFVSDYRKKQHR